MFVLVKMGKKKMVKMSLDEFQSSLGNQSTSTGEVDVSDLPTAPRAYVKMKFFIIIKFYIKYEI